MKRFLVISAITLFCALLTSTINADDSKLLDATGTIKAKMEKPDRIVLTIQGGGAQIGGGATISGGACLGGPTDKVFIYKHDGKKDCRAFDELNIGDNVIVSYKEKKDELEAVCIKNVSTPTLQGGNMQNGSMQ